MFDEVDPSFNLTEEIPD
jgi:hypothetical protein